MATKRIKVYTFYEERPGRAPRVSAYTMWVNPTWPGCKTIEVDAINGTEAKKIAIKLRRQEEARLTETRS
jgi:hypothetical protein